MHDFPSDIAAGILLLFLSLLLAVAALHFHRRGKPGQALVAILLLGFLLRLFCATDPMLHRWDERYHALVAKNMIDTPLEPRLYKTTILPFDYKDWTANGIWLHKQPFPLWTMALSMKALGVHELSLRLPSLLLSTICIYLTFLIGKALYSARAGLVAAALHSLNGLAIELAAGRVTTDHNDTFFFFLIELSVYLVVRSAEAPKHHYRHLLLAGICCGLAVLTKWLAALIVLPLYLIMNLRRDALPSLFKGLAFLLATIAAVAMPWQVYAARTFPAEYAWEQHANLLHLTDVLTEKAQPWWYFLNRIRITVNEAVYVALAWFGLWAFRNKALLRQNTFVACWIFVPLAIFSLAKSKMQGYVLFTFPAYFIVLGLFIAGMADERQRVSGSLKRSLLGLAIALVFALAARYAIERVKPFDPKEAEKAAREEMESLPLPPGAVLFNCPCPVEVMFYSDCIAYRDIPGKQVVDSLSAVGYPLFVVNRGNLPGWTRKYTAMTKVAMPATVRLCSQ